MVNHFNFKKKSLFTEVLLPFKVIGFKAITCTKCNKHKHVKYPYFAILNRKKQEQKNMQTIKQEHFFVINIFIKSTGSHNGQLSSRR